VFLAGLPFAFSGAFENQSRARIRIQQKEQTGLWRNQYLRVITSRGQRVITYGTAAADIVATGLISIDAGRRELLVDGAPVQLAPKEFDLFWELLDHSGLVLTRDQLLERVWGYTFAGDTRTVDVHVRQLRRKIGETCPIVTVWGVGYKVADDASAVS